MESGLDLTTFAENQLKNVSTGELETFGNLWKEKTTVFVFFRRWGCLFCRLWAKEISSIAPTLRENNVRLIGIGVEELGVQDFLKGNFFDGEVFVDPEKKSYKALTFKRYGLFSLLAALITGESRTAIYRGKRLNLGGDMVGDKMQIGGALVVSAGGKEVLLYFKQQRIAEHLSNSKFLEVLGLADVPPGVNEASSSNEKAGSRSKEGESENASNSEDTENLLNKKPENISTNEEPENTSNDCKLEKLASDNKLEKLASDNKLEKPPCDGEMGKPPCDGEMEKPPSDGKPENPPSDGKMEKASSNRMSTEAEGEIQF